MTEADELSRQEKFSGTKAVADKLRFDEKRLEQYLADMVDGFEGPMTVNEFKGGQSNPTYQLVTPNRKYVMRRKPPGTLLPSAHAVDREYRVITALYSIGYPVPRTYLLCEDESVAGTMFYIMDCVDGRIYWDPDIQGIGRDERAAIYDAMNDTIARLHNVDYKALGLEDFGRPGNYFARQISRWSKQYVASESETIVEMNKLMEWLPDNIPEDDSTSIVHGDYRLDNMILHPTEPKVIAVLDWELSTIGHPLADFTYHMMQWRMPAGGTSSGTATIADLDIAALGIPGEKEYADAYCRRTGRESIANMDYYMAYNFFRLAGILQGIVGRVRDGTAASEHAAANADAVRPLAERAWTFAQAAGAT